MNHPLPWLRYVDADRVNAPDLSFDGLKVRNDSMETLGSVEGFVVDSTSMRPYYVVVDSGGWFKSKDFLVPIGHTRLDEDRDALVINIPKERIERFPGFNRDEFATLKKDDVQRMNDAIRDALGDTPALYTPASDMPISSADPLLSAWGRPAYTQPDWWAGVAPPLGSGLSADDTFRASADYMASEVPVAFGEMRADELVGREWEGRDRRLRKGGNPQMRAQAADASRGQASMRARATDQSPHPEGRAQPGDVLGVETGGEQTHIGETADDEDKRRFDAERAAAKRRE